jgi:hypothetical protein
MKLLITMLIAVLFNLPVYANQCGEAMATIEDIVVKTNSALDANNIDQMSDVASDIKLDANRALVAADSCDCDDAYYTAETILENANGAYLSDSVDEATDYLNSVKENVADAKKYVKACSVQLAKQ